jgi:hypothetical protein
MISKANRRMLRGLVQKRPPSSPLQTARGSGSTDEPIKVYLPWYQIDFKDFLECHRICGTLPMANSNRPDHPALDGISQDDKDR